MVVCVCHRGDHDQEVTSQPIGRCGVGGSHCQDKWMQNVFVTI